MALGLSFIVTLYAAKMKSTHDSPSWFLRSSHPSSHCRRSPSAAVTVPVEYHKLGNGLKVVLSRDTSSPTAVVGVYYNIGFRIEPKDRTGFAHLFEHMMFQGSEHLGKNEFIGLVQSNGGILNGSTRFDFTNYFKIIPAHTRRDDPLGRGRPHARPERSRRRT